MKGFSIRKTQNSITLTDHYKDSVEFSHAANLYVQIGEEEAVELNRNQVIELIRFLVSHIPKEDV